MIRRNSVRRGLSRRAPRFLAYGLVALALVAVATEASAFRMIQNFSTGRVTSGSLVTCTSSGGFTHWTTRYIVWRLNTAGQGAGKASAIQSALAAWTNVPSANHELVYHGTTTAGWATDGANTVLFASGNGCTGSCLALTALVLQSGQRIVETDVTFNAGYTWNTSGSDYDVQAVATHEFGHALGIHHTEITTTPRPTMYASYFGTGGRSLEADDRSALQCSENRYSTLPTAVGQSATYYDEDICLIWGAVPGAVSYRLYTLDSFGNWILYRLPTSNQYCRELKPKYITWSIRVSAVDSSGTEGPLGPSFNYCTLYPSSTWC